MLSSVGAIADSGLDGVFTAGHAFGEKIDTWQGRVTNRAITEFLGMQCAKNPFAEWG